MRLNKIWINSSINLTKQLINNKTQIKNSSNIYNQKKLNEGVLLSYNNQKDHHKDFINHNIQY